MNILEIIKDRLSGPVLGQLSSAIGLSEDTTKSAAGAVVPALLSSFSTLASTGGGARRLIGAIDQFSPGSAGPPMGGGADALIQRGTGVAQSLLGSEAVSSVVGSLTRNFGIAPQGAGKLLGFLTPTVLGSIASQFSGKPLTPRSLTSFFSDQKRAISRALPAGFPGAESPVRTAPSKVAEYSGRPPSRPRWMVPTLVGLAALVGFLLYSRSKPSGPGSPEPTRTDASRIADEFNDSVGSLTGTLNGVRDGATAEAALPRIEEMKGRLESLQAAAAKLPESARARFDETARSSLEGLREESRRVSAIPDAGEKLKPVLDDLMSRLGVPAGGAPADVK